uniref:ATP synthase F0 subunit 6 n=1 Tax=Pleurosicya micheli TaxID=595630 RepID=UPI0028FCF45F|nr:ATP synthase F0 subunit 6 [Pleurosicya micheli]WNH38099.1 ATP synthase F0 subunit 6 [Pleurosicya micheli]
MVSLFSQFSSPELFGVPLIVLALLMPSLLLPTPTKQLLMHRHMATQSTLSKQFTYQIFSPLSSKGHKWAIMLLSVFIFILSLNMLGLLPYTFTPTAQLSITLGLAFPLWFATLLQGLRNQPTHTLGHLLPEGAPGPLTPVLIIIESISLLIRPFALAVRLAANLTAGHLLIHLVSTASFTIVPLMPILALLSTLALFLLTTLEIGVAMIQAYVFTLLLSLYLQENI